VPPFAPPSEPMAGERVLQRIEECPSLPSLRTINNALGDLVHAEQSFTAQIAEIVRRDPSLTSRVLRLVNSVFFGLSKRITNIEDAIFYLGLKHIRELALTTPVIEDCLSLQREECKVDWTQMWRHSIACAMLTRELLNVSGHHSDEETDYIAGLVHNVGKLVMGFAFPDEFDRIQKRSYPNIAKLLAAEREELGWDHALIGAYYLKRHNLGDDVVSAVKWHHDPSRAGNHVLLASAIQVADALASYHEIPGIDHLKHNKGGSWQELPGWEILFGADRKRAAFRAESAIHLASRLPELIRELV